MAAAAALPLLWISVAFSQAPPAPLDPTIPSVRSLDCYERLPTEAVNLSLREAATQNTLRLLAQSYKINMVVTDDVKGTVTLDFYRAPVRDVFQAILDANGLVCVRQGELLRVSTAARLVQDERGRNDALISRVGRDADLTKRINDLQKQAADSSISLAASEVTRKNAELIARRGEIKQEIVRLRYADPGQIGKTVAALVGIGPQATFTSCRVKKTEDKLVPEAIDAAGGGGASAQSEQERSAANLARAASGGYGLQTVVPVPGAVVGPPGGLGAQPPFSALFGPQPVVPVPAPEPVPGSGGLVGLTGGGSFNISTAETSPTIRTDCDTNSIVLRLYEEQMRRAKEAIDRHLDVLPPQVKIESRLEILDRTELFALGVQWGGGGLLGINNRTAIVGRGFTSGQNNTQGIGTAGFGSPGPNPNLPLTNVIPVSGTTGLATGGNLVNLPIASLLEGAAASGGGGFAFGIIGSRMDLNLALEALRIQNRTQSLARPEVVVSENQKALVSLGEEIPYSTVSAAGTQVQFKKATLQLEVIPAVVCRDDSQVARTGGTHRLRMTVLVQNDTRGLPVDLGPNGAPPAINTQKTQTEATMLEGQRLVIGGITQIRTRDQLRKVPLLGDIPIFGWLFKQKGQDDQKRELVVFMTPSVLKSQAPPTTPNCPAPVALKDQSN
jgi:type II secretory pathway component HofQ